jgi:hypothetical protein
MPATHRFEAISAAMGKVIHRGQLIDIAFTAACIGSKMLRGRTLNIAAVEYLFGMWLAKRPKY